jgi:hypothetical protein
MAAHLVPRPWVLATTLAALALGLVPSATAQAPEDLWNKARERVELGERVIFEATGAPRQTGLLQSISAEGLTVMVAGQATTVRREDVAKLWKKGDSKLNGFLFGAGITAITMGLAVAAFCVYDCDADAAFVGFVALYSGLGGLVGFGVDAMIDGKTLLYKRPAGVAIAPIVTPDRVGVQARLAW